MEPAERDNRATRALTQLLLLRSATTLSEIHTPINTGRRQTRFVQFSVVRVLFACPRSSSRCVLRVFRNLRNPRDSLLSVLTQEM